MKKKLLLLLSALVLLMSAAFLFACGESEHVTHSDSEGDRRCDVCGKVTYVYAEGEIELIKNGKATFNIVLPSNIGGDKRLYLIQNLVQPLNMLGSKIELVSDKAETAGDVEVLVGEVNSRGAEYSIDSHYLGNSGYAVTYVGNKVILIGGSDEALSLAIDYFINKVLGGPFSADVPQDVKMTSDKVIEIPESGYDVPSVSVGGTPLADYVISADMKNKEDVDAMRLFQSLVYAETGIWLEECAIDSVPERAFVFKSVESCSKEGFTATESGGKVTLECEFPHKFSVAVEEFFNDVIADKSEGAVIGTGFTYSYDVRNVFYADFGAKGDGKTDDFLAIKECHEYANLYGHTVSADSGNPVYYIGADYQGYETVVIKTDTSWEGAKFIFDDSAVEVGSGPYYSPIFTIARDSEREAYSGESVPITSSLVKGETENIGWAPGYPALLLIESYAVRHFIRFGSNENNGNTQREIILVDAEGNIDPTTPLQWTYDKVDAMYAYRIDDKPITVSGGELGCDIETICNQAPSKYTYYARNIFINRSNATLSGIRHSITGILDHCAPYDGFTKLESCNNVTVKDMLFQCPRGYKTTGANGDAVGMGTYEITAKYANNVLWENCRQSNFFREKGKVVFDGMMGTNYCKNLAFNNMFVCSFDAHAGTYNATIENSTLEHMNFIGEGTIKIRNTTVYTDGTNAGLCFRSDYGSTWEGVVDIDGLELRTSKSADELTNLTLIQAYYNNHYFGYACHLPRTLNIKNVRVVRFDYMSLFGKRIEKQKEVNHVPLFVYWHMSGFDYDYSDPNATVGKENDLHKCTCAEDYPKANYPSTPFNDTDGDGRCNNVRIVYRDGVYTKDDSVWCWGTEGEVDPHKNVNPIRVTREINVSNIGNLVLKMPTGPAFSELTVNVTESEFVPWYAAEQEELTIRRKKAVAYVDN